MNLNPAFISQQSNEYDAWLEVVDKLHEFGVGNINEGEPHQPLYTAIVKWGEELAELRRLDPDPKHGQNALAEKRGM